MTGFTVGLVDLKGLSNLNDSMILSPGPVAMILYALALILCCLMLNAQTEIQRKKPSMLSDSSLKCIETAEFAPCLGPQL